jgi:hypothetical protein
MSLLRLRSARAAPCGTYRSFSIAARTRESVSGSTLAGTFSARDTVAVDTPARRATSRALERSAIVGSISLPAGFATVLLPHAFVVAASIARYRFHRIVSITVATEWLTGCAAIADHM